MASDTERNVLSIQSHVVYGYVGNKSASFPLQVLGFDVSPVNSVQFSNHTGYGKFKGQILNCDDMAELYHGLQENKINSFSHLLTGYIGSKSFLEKVGEIASDLKKDNKNLTYVCDPVMGDHGKMYVPEELLPVYQDVIVPLADIVTPNQYETELLTGQKITSEEDAIKAMDMLHAKGPKIVVLSSCDFGNSETIISLASSIKNEKKEVYRIEFKKLDAIFVGTGDLFAACLLAWMSIDKDLKLALEKTISTLQAVIKTTLEHAKEKAGKEKPTSAQMELRLIQSKANIENPKISHAASPL